MTTRPTTPRPFARLRWTALLLPLVSVACVMPQSGDQDGPDYLPDGALADHASDAALPQRLALRPVEPGSGSSPHVAPLDGAREYLALAAVAVGDGERQESPPPDGDGCDDPCDGPGDEADLDAVVEENDRDGDGKLSAVEVALYEVNEKAKGASDADIEDTVNALAIQGRADATGLELDAWAAELTEDDLESLLTANQIPQDQVGAYLWSRLGAALQQQISEHTEDGAERYAWAVVLFMLRAYDLAQEGNPLAFDVLAAWLHNANFGFNPSADQLAASGLANAAQALPGTASYALAELQGALQKINDNADPFYQGIVDPQARAAAIEATKQALAAAIAKLS